MARTPTTKKRRRGWAWTLTIIAALLAVVWVGSMKVGLGITSPKCSVYFGGGATTFIRISPVRATVYDVWWRSRDSWKAVWWFDHAEETLPTVGQTLFGLQAPLWPFVLLTGVPGVWMLVKTRRHTNPHACPACGYDRTGLPQSSTGPAPCPECGKGKDENR